MFLYQTINFKNLPSNLLTIFGLPMEKSFSLITFLKIKSEQCEV